MISQSKTGYSSLQIGLHWIIAALVLFQLLFGESMKAMVDASEEGRTLSPADLTMGNLHYWIGLAILALVVVRLAVRLFRGAPAPSQAAPGWMLLAARTSHILFYALLFATPVLGLLAFYVGDPFGDIHSLNKPVFIVLIAVHTVAALYHQVWLKDGTLRRMLSPAS